MQRSDIATPAQNRRHLLHYQVPITTTYTSRFAIIALFYYDKTKTCRNDITLYLYSTTYKTTAIHPPHRKRATVKTITRIHHYP
ncbi:MAG: hypothetical protein LBI79_04840 [Nitrososphaerota archaeon]|nr:hypothetical protein [Nitrososphaerota archaeon]